MRKVENSKRTLPLLPSIKTLLLTEKYKQELNVFNENYDFNNCNFVCLKKNGTRLNINTLSRNLRYLSRNNVLPDLWLSDLKICLENQIEKLAKSYDFYRAWIRFDCRANNPRNVYDKFNLNGKRFVKTLDNFISQSKPEMEM